MLLIFISLLKSSISLFSFFLFEKIVVISRLCFFYYFDTYLRIFRIMAKFTYQIWNLSITLFVNLATKFKFPENNIFPPNFQSNFTWILCYLFQYGNKYHYHYIILYMRVSLIHDLFLEDTFLLLSKKKMVNNYINIFILGLEWVILLFFFISKGILVFCYYACRDI